ncbi:MAG: hypothetical protein Q7S49_02130 [bacterium]|nr:hypothetical protein [bacterium]
MKVSVTWRTETPKAADIAGAVSQKLGFAVMPEYDEQYKRQGLSFECKSLHDWPDERPELALNGMFLMNETKQYLRDHHEVHGERMVDGWDIGAHACMLERRVRHLERAVKWAIANLKQTRSWLKDKRFAEIRYELEEAMTAPLR